jgi:hypothetical protein
MRHDKPALVISALMLAVAVVLTAASVGWGWLIAADSSGIAVELREKYGPVVYDTGTVIMIYDNCFVITHRDGLTAWYPVGNYAVSKITKIKEGAR